MQYTVEVRRVGGDLLSLMSQMRTWLDHSRVEPDCFRYSVGSPATSFRLDFKVEKEAIAFASSFGGRILGSFDDFHPIPARAVGEPTGATLFVKQRKNRRQDDDLPVNDRNAALRRRSA
jgi:hypothetical protein